MPKAFIRRSFIFNNDYPQNDLLFWIIERKDDNKGRSTEILVAKNVFLPELSRDSGDIFQLKAIKDIRATFLNHLFTSNATKILKLRS